MSAVFVRCSRCGNRVSNVIPVDPARPEVTDLIVRAWVECPECVEKRAPVGDAPPT